MKKIAYISTTLSNGASGGSQFSSAALKIFSKLPNAVIQSIVLNADPAPADFKIKTASSKIFIKALGLIFFCNGVHPVSAYRLLKILLKSKPDVIWLDTSLLGILIPLIKLTNQRANIYVHFQNFEYGLMRGKSKYVLPTDIAAAYVNEFISARFANASLVFHDTDKAAIEKAYGAHNAQVLSLPVNDIYDPLIVEDKIDYDILFVGSAWYANIEAIEFISNFIAPQLPHLRFLVVGAGLEKYSTKFERSNLRVMGYVESLANIYMRSRLVVAPIFSGGGIKVKIAEALMFGKHVVASPFAGIGYEKCTESVHVVRDKSEYCSAIEILLSSKLNSKTARCDFQSNFSTENYMIKLKELLRIYSD